MQALERTGEFEVRVVTRNESKTLDLSTNVEVFTADYSSVRSLSYAFVGFDVVVNAIGDRVSGEHRLIFDAVLAAGVKHYIPSQWGSTPRTAAILAIPFMKEKVDIMDLVQNAAEEGKITFTSFAGGPWLEYLMGRPSLMSIPDGVFYMHEHPDFEFGVTTKSFFGQALVEALRRPEATKNKHINVQLARLSQNKALALAREAKPNKKIRIVQANCNERYRKGMASLATGRTDKAVFADIFSKCIFDPETNPLPNTLDNDLLGLPLLTDKAVEEMLVIMYP